MVFSQSHHFPYFISQMWNSLYAKPWAHIHPLYPHQRLPLTIVSPPQGSPPWEGQVRARVNILIELPETSGINQEIQKIRPQTPRSRQCPHRNLQLLPPELLTFNASSSEERDRQSVNMIFMSLRYWINHTYFPWKGDWEVVRANFDWVCMMTTFAPFSRRVWTICTLPRRAAKKRACPRLTWWGGL